jgi:hypothetical protein
VAIDEAAERAGLGFDNQGGGRGLSEGRTRGENDSGENDKGAIGVHRVG